MKFRTSRGVAASVTAGIMLFALLSPAAASADDGPDGALPSNGSTVYVDPKLEGTTIDRSTLPPTSSPDISPELRAQLDELGLTGPVLTVQEGANGLGTYYADDEGWVLDLGPNSSSGVTTQAFSYGICTGYFNTPAHVATYLQWGGQSSCYASDGQYYLHQVKAALYDTCIGPFCAILTYRATATSPASSNFNNVATAYGALNCVNGNGRTYEQKIDVTVRSVAYGPFWQRDVVVNTCSVAP